MVQNSQNSQKWSKMVFLIINSMGWPKYQVTKTEMSNKLKFQENWNFTMTKILQNLKMPSKSKSKSKLKLRRSALIPLVLLDQTLSIWLGIQFRQHYCHIAQRKLKQLWIFLVLPDLETQGFWEFILNWFKAYSSLTMGLKTVGFWLYFHTFQTCLYISRPGYRESVKKLLCPCTC